MAAAGLEKDASRRDDRRGRGARGFGARVVGVLLLALAIGLGYNGVVSGLYEPFAKATPGAIVVEHCAHNEGKRSRAQECEGTFLSDDRKVKEPDADIPTDDPKAKGERIPAVQIGDSSYAASVGVGVASGLRYLFGGLCALGPAFFCLAAGRWPGPRAAGTLREMPSAFSWLTYPMVGIGLVGLLVATLITWGAG